MLLTITFYIDCHFYCPAHFLSITVWLACLSWWPSDGAWSFFRLSWSSKWFHNSPFHSISWLKTTHHLTRVPRSDTRTNKTTQGQTTRNLRLCFVRLHMLHYALPWSLSLSSSCLYHAVAAASRVACSRLNLVFNSFNTHGIKQGGRNDTRHQTKREERYKAEAGMRRTAKGETRETKRTNLNRVGASFASIPAQHTHPIRIDLNVINFHKLILKSRPH